MKPTTCSPVATRKRFSSFVLLSFLALWAFSERAIAAPPPGGIAPVNVPAGGFGIDGNLLANVPIGGAGDWVSNSLPGGGVLSPGGVPLNAATTFHFLDAYNDNNDLIFNGGLKWTDNPNVWGDRKSVV